ncbi:HMG box domain-containing protein [Pycnococcus provasolii]
MSVLGISALAPVMAPASSVFAAPVRSYGRKANAAPAPPAAPLAKAAPEKKVPRQKREPSAYAKFVKAKFTSVRTDLARQHGKPLADIKLPEVSAVMSQEWKGLTDDEKAKFK